MKKKIKTIRRVVVLVAVGVLGWNACQDFMLFRNGDGTEYKEEFVPDSGSYSSYAGNTMNGTNLYVNEDGEVLVHFSSSVNRGAESPSDYIGNLTTGEVYFGGYHTFRDPDFGVRYDDLIFYGEDFYGLEMIGGKDDEQYVIVKGDLADGSIETMIDNGVNNIMYVNDVMYYQHTDNLYRINPKTAEEELVVEGASGNYFFHNDTLYFIKESLLHSMSLTDKNITKLSDYTCSWAFMHEGQIFYNGKEYGFPWLMSMNPDGTNNKAHMILGSNKVGVYDGKLYFVKETLNSGEGIFYIDLNDSKMQAVQIEVKEKAAKLLCDFYGENIEKRLRQFPDSDTGSEMVLSRGIQNFEVCDGYIVFYLEGTINSWTMKEAFLYNIETKEVSLLNEMLGLDIFYDYYLRME